MIVTNLLVMLVCGTIVAVYALIVRDPLRIAGMEAWVMTAAIVAMSTWWLRAPETWAPVMNERGPVTAIAALAVGVCLAVWGYHRPARAAIGLVAIAVSPLVGAVLAADSGFAMAGTSTVVAVSPFLTCALLYPLSHRLSRRKSRTDVALNA